MCYNAVFARKCKLPYNESHNVEFQFSYKQFHNHAYIRLYSKNAASYSACMDASQACSVEFYDIAGVESWYNAAWEFCSILGPQHRYNVAWEHCDTWELQRNGIFREESFHNAFHIRMMVYNVQYSGFDIFAFFRRNIFLRKMCHNVVSFRTRIFLRNVVRNDLCNKFHNVSYNKVHMFCNNMCYIVLNTYFRQD